MSPGHKATAGTIMGLKVDLERHLGKDVSLMSKRALLFNAEHTPSGRLFYNAIRADLKQVLQMAGQSRDALLLLELVEHLEYA